MSSQHKNKRRAWQIVLIIALLMLAASLCGLLVYFLPQFIIPEPTAPSVDIPPTSATSTGAVSGELLPENPIDFAALQAKNPETVAWIKIPDTVIDYPIMQSGNDREENYYLNHNSHGVAERAGSIYIQKINAPDFTNPNTVIYGHNMASGKMFAAIRRYQHKDFFDNHRYITVYTSEHILTYEVYSAFVYDNRHILNSFNFFVEDEYNAFLQQTLNPASMTRQVRENVSVTTNARIITLSTCTGRSSERFLVIGVLVNDQQTQ